MQSNKVILCYGDSNTWGYVPQPWVYHEPFKIKRYPKEKRWTGVLRTLLEGQFDIIEEGLNSRTTNLSYPIEPDRNGQTYLLPCLYSHAPIDLVILSLGGNDLKTYFNRTPLQIVEGIDCLINMIQSSLYGKNFSLAPAVLVTSLLIPLGVAEKFIDEQGVYVFNNAIAKAKEVSALLRQFSEGKKYHFLQLPDNIKPSSIDGLHLDEKDHLKLATLLSEEILRLNSLGLI